MANINTKFLLRIDTYANWTNDQLGEGKGALRVLEHGEIGLCEIPTKRTDDPVVQTPVPTVLFKVGDGTHTFQELKWASALAADVYDWAKCRYVELDGEILKFHNGDKTQPVHTVDFSKFALDADLGDVTTLTTTAKTAVGAINEHDAEIGDLTVLATTNKNNLVNAINEVRQAVEVGGTGSVVTVEKAETPTTGSSATYVVKQGGNAVTGDKIEIPSFPDVYTKTETDTKFRTEDQVNDQIDTKVAAYDFGSMAKEDKANYYTKTEVETGYKPKQDAVADPTANGNATEFIATIAQDENGKITVTKKKIEASDLGLESAMHFVGALSEAPATAKAGDVYLNTATKKEYVYDTTNGWIELGDEGSYALKTIKIEGVGDLAGGGDLSANRTIDLTPANKTKLGYIDTEKSISTAISEAVNGLANDAVKANADAIALLNKTDGTPGSVKATAEEMAEAAIVAQNFKALAKKDTVGTTDIDDKAVTKDKLEQNVQTSLDKADTAIQPVSDTPRTSGHLISWSGDEVEDAGIAKDDLVVKDDLADIATTGSIYDINEANGETVKYLIFNGGSALSDW